MKLPPVNSSELLFVERLDSLDNMQIFVQTVSGTRRTSTVEVQEDSTVQDVLKSLEVGSVSHHFLQVSL